MRVGLFDSGIGGLTVLKSLIDRYPLNDYIYLGDTKNLPYGSKTKDELLTLAKHNVEFLLTKKVDMIVIACGTVSSNCLSEIKEAYKIANANDVVLVAGKGHEDYQILANETIHFDDREEARKIFGNE